MSVDRFTGETGYSQVVVELSNLYSVRIVVGPSQPTYESDVVWMVLTMDEARDVLQGLAAVIR